MSDHPAMLITTAITFVGLAVFMVVTGEGYVGSRVGFYSVATQRVDAPFVLMVAAGIFTLGLAAAFEGVGGIFTSLKTERWNGIVLVLSWGGLGLFLLGAIMQVLANA